MNTNYYCLIEWNKDRQKNKYTKTESIQKTDFKIIIGCLYVTN